MAEILLFDFVLYIAKINIFNVVKLSVYLFMVSTPYVLKT